MEEMKRKQMPLQMADGVPTTRIEMCQENQMDVDSAEASSSRNSSKSSMSSSDDQDEKSGSEEMEKTVEDKCHPPTPSSSDSNTVMDLPLGSATSSNPKNIGNGLVHSIKLSNGTGQMGVPQIGRPSPPSPFRALTFAQSALAELCANNANLLRVVGITALLVAWHVFLVLASFHSPDRSAGLLLFTGLGWLLWLYTRWLSRPVHSLLKPLVAQWQRLWRHQLLVRIAIYALVLGGIIVFLLLDTKRSRHRLFGLLGMGFYILLMLICSHSPSNIVWRPVLWGFLLQFLMGLCVLRWEWGSQHFNDFSDSVIIFLDFAKNGTDFVYGFLSTPPNICGMDPVFAFGTAQVVIYFGAVVALLYHFGIMQWAIRKLAWCVQMTLNTTATESLNACACIFLGQSEAPLLIRPYLDRMTASELHAVMTAGFSCIAGSVFATYISLGACPRYLLSATVMSAPGSLACSKILFPETEKSQLVSVEDLELPVSEETNALECISNGAVMAVELVLAIVANLIVFLALLALLDSVLGWMGELVGQPGWSFELLLGYLFFPLAFVMGVTNVNEAFCVAQLMGTKTALNEFIAYKQLGQMVNQNMLSSRSAMIATYALCGFSNFTSIGIQLGILGGMAPSRKRLLSRLALRALLAGSISCFMTASLAGVLVDQPIACHPRRGNTNCFDVDKFMRNGTAYSSSLPTAASWLVPNKRHSEL